MEQINESKLKILSGIILTVFLMMFIRLWALQIMQGADIVLRSQANHTRVTRINAPRGLFYDSNGEILVSSRISRNVSVVSEDLEKNPYVYDELARLLKMTKEEIKAKLAINPKKPRSPYEYVTICKDIPPETAIKILEAQINLPGVEVDEIPVRLYKYGEYAAHAFGYIREINTLELMKLKYDNYKLGDLIGKNGLEQTYEKYLRGTDGGRVFEVDIYGRRTKNRGFKEPQPGNNLHLTINHKVQMAAEKALDEQLAYLQKYTRYKNAKSGVVVALDPRNGNVLAMVSKPGYDPNIFVGPISQDMANNLYRNKLYPLLNRAIKGEYSPGSTFKPVTVLAALRENAITKDEKFYCRGYDSQWGEKFKCWIISSAKRMHGSQTVIDGLKNSCNIVMGEISRRIGADNMAKYTRMFGFGRETGLDLAPGESSGLVADPAWKKANTRDKEWYPLETMMFGIGQGYLTVTPLQLAQFYAALANGGTIYRPQIVSKITDSTGGVIQEFPSLKTGNIGVTPAQLAIVREGLEEVINEGTAAYYFHGFPLDKYPIAGKTGTAQRPPYDNSGVFASFAPANKPEIVVIVLIEQGGSGSGGASPVARKIFEAYFDVKKPEPVVSKSTETSTAGDSAQTAPTPAAEVHEPTDIVGE